MPEVRCAVNNCHFWGQGNFCQANAIVVQPDSKAYTNLNDESYYNAVLQGHEISSDVAASAETCCQTFRQKY
ncbi:DUF1540 domain-containing protein [Ectobacillus ponti]|uniref:DUF1540 domain-containing protein n=1 Tax=Ectobacillus ponti TaxID=2961894 RepID=A0AA41X3S9_9BACI|nr:DUF1540 domain-containing protein [Ectobacillus ponti]MCP8968147.1 DUF1540 domain-containing protein [Ectobacillus ponti]